MKKAFMYVFWIFLALKFKDQAFGNFNHWEPTAAVFDTNEFDAKQIYDLKNEDLKIGRDRRISFIKYWRMKF